MTTSATLAEDRVRDDIADLIRDQVCCPRIHGCELGGSDECPAERVRSALQALTLERDAMREGLAEIAEGITPSARVGHYMAFQRAVKIARSLLHPHHEG